jgi:hypothetical protein
LPTPIPKRLHRLIAEVGQAKREPPPEAGSEAALCYVLEQLVRGELHLASVGPEPDHLHTPRPYDTRFAWERMGDPVRCSTSRGHQITMWPWLDLQIWKEHVELLVIQWPDGRTYWVTPEVRAYYRDKLKTGFFGPNT